MNTLYFVTNLFLIDFWFLVIMENLKSIAWEWIISGGYKKGGSWGGQVCADYVSFDVHVMETAVWLVFLFALFVIFGFNGKLKRMWNEVTLALQTQDRKLTKFNMYNVLDTVIGSLAFGNWLLVVWYKINLRSLINLLQPCHLTSMMQGIALLTDGPSSVMIALLSLPMVAGSGGTFFAPDTSGLDQPFEEEMFWVQHILLQTIPLYMLLRHDALALRMMDFKTIAIGNWFLVLTHWAIFEPIDYNFQVNVNFFLCPADAMLYLFNTILHPVMLLPSYRTFAMWFFVAVSIPLCYLYIYTGKAIYYSYGAITGSSSSTDADATKKKLS